MPIDARINNLNEVEKEFLSALFERDSKRRLGCMPQEDESFMNHNYFNCSENNIFDIDIIINTFDTVLMLMILITKQQD